MRLVSMCHFEIYACRVYTLYIQIFKLRYDDALSSDTHTNDSNTKI